MKTCFLFLVLVCLNLWLGPVVNAQQASPNNTASAPVSPHNSKLAVIDTEAFYDPDKGIAQLIVAGQALEQEFQPRRAELQTLQQRVQSLTDELNRTAAVTDVKVQQEKREQVQALQRELKYKTEDAEDAYRKRLQTIFTPLIEAISKALDDFSLQLGIGIVLDVGKLQETLLYSAPDLDLTRAFIADYNKRNPAALLKK